MKISKNIFLNKKILIYGLGKRGTSVYKFLKDMPEDQYLNYQESLKDFLENKSEEFSCHKFSSTISSKIIDVINNQI